MEASISEIADGIYRFSALTPDIASPVGLSLNPFLILGDQPLFHSGWRKAFPLVQTCLKWSYLRYVLGQRGALQWQARAGLKKFLESIDTLVRPLGAIANATR